jgi:serine phosphatase RsbU (regulator of sigma subunit)/anti-sigma regulatory factor (Ser/Thr protein kinase)
VFPNWRIGSKLLVLTVPLIAAATLLATWTLYRLNAERLQAMLKDRANSIAHQVMADRQYYGAAVVPRVGELKGSLGADYRDVHGRFPLPATFVREVSEQIARSGDGYTTRLISPWPINKEMGPRDSFETDGFASLAHSPGDPFVKVDTVEGRAVMRVLMADVATSTSCVSCHNAHPQSPKHDFRLYDVMGGLEVIIPMDQYLAESRQELAMTLGSGLVLCFLVLGIVSVGARWTVTRPLAHIAERMAQFMRQQPDEQASGQTPELPRGDEAAYLAQSFSKMASVIRSQQTALQEANTSLEQRVQERTAELRRTTAEKERIGSELRIASEIQKSILPRTFPPFPDRTDFEIYATTIPALEMGGDFYDFFLIDDNRLGVVIADVSGKGVPAAIFMAVSRSLIKATALASVSPSECLEHVNRLLCPDNESAMFVTVFYGILHTETGELEFSNGGHNVPYVIGGDRLVPVGTPSGMALGIVDDVRYQTSRVSLSAGETLVLYTDGVTEAMDAQGRLFSTPRFERTLHRLSTQRPIDLLTKVVEDVHAFSSGTLQTDDITMLALRYRQPALLELTLANRSSELQRLASEVERFAQSQRIPDADVHALSLALDEVITNTISYGYDDQGAHEIRVRLMLANGRLSAEVEDDGRPFDPLTTPQPDLTSAVEDRPVGGLGIHLVRSLMEQVDYRRESGKNHLIMSKRLSAVAQAQMKAGQHGNH